VDTLHPYSLKKFSVFFGLQDAGCRKMLSEKNLAAESSQERTYSTKRWSFVANRRHLSSCYFHYDEAHELICKVPWKNLAPKLMEATFGPPLSPPDVPLLPHSL
jgi:hypothetical protein